MKGSRETPAYTPKKIETVPKRIRERNTNERNHKLIDPAQPEISSPNFKRVKNTTSPCNDVDC